MIFAGETPIHDTIAFSKTTRAISLMEDSPPGVRLCCTRLKCYSKWSLPDGKQVLCYRAALIFSSFPESNSRYVTPERILFFEV
jgi:hypothetical protein